MNGERLHSQPLGHCEFDVHWFVQRLPLFPLFENLMHFPSAHSELASHVSPRLFFDDVCGAAPPDDDEEDDDVDSPAFGVPPPPPLDDDDDVHGLACCGEIPDCSPSPPPPPPGPPGAPPPDDDDDELVACFLSSDVPLLFEPSAGQFDDVLLDGVVVSSPEHPMMETVEDAAKRTPTRSESFMAKSFFVV